jgi:UDP-N-acetylmuramyl tripeptide synthase
MSLKLIQPLTKLISSSIKKLGLGNASSLPGRIALKLNSNILNEIAALIPVNSLKIAVSGTNGKTTTTGLIKSIVQTIDFEENSTLVSNDLGANLYYGICTAFLKSNLENQDIHYILEVDEAAFPKVSHDLSPNLIAITNIYRDQLDRFGEIEATKNLLINAISKTKAKLAFNLNDNKLLDLIPHATEGTVTYTLEIPDHFTKNLDQDQMLLVDNVLGSTAKPDYKFKLVQANEEYIELELAEPVTYFKVKLPGIYNAYNVCLAISMALSLNIPIEFIKAGLSSYKAAFGRAQTMQLPSGSHAKLFLIKNPSGCTQVLNLLTKSRSAIKLIIINDNYADGKDVSWLWDAEFDLLADTSSFIVLSGSRAYDMALRMKYTGIETDKLIVIEDINQALEKVQELNLQSDNEEDIYILPTYTALLYLEKILKLN